MLPFQAYNPHGELRIYNNGFLPHWRQSGCTYFVTFRLADSVPTAQLDKWEEEKAIWLKRFGVERWTKQTWAKIPRDERRRIERHFAKLLNECLDHCHGSCMLREPALAEIVSNVLRHFHPARVFTGDTVVMPNHVHALMQPRDADGYELEDVLHSIKSFTAKKINAERDTHGQQVWQAHSYDHIVRDNQQLTAFQRYIRKNPAKAKLRENEFILHEADYDLEWP
jgi:type I restriction enzyme R subunit